MRKADPQLVKAGWSAELAAHIDSFQRTKQALDSTQHKKADVSRLAASTFLAAFVAFEGFCSDLFIAYLNRDFSHYQNDLEQQIDRVIRSRFGRWARSRTQFRPLDHVDVDNLALAVDPSYKNLTFRDANTIIKRANTWLAPQYRHGIVSLDNHDRRLYNTAKGVRNYIAHQSRAAKDEMNAQLATVDQGHPNLGLGRGTNSIHYVGSFLKSACYGATRVEQYIRRLDDLIRKM